MSDPVFPAPYESDPPAPDERRRCPRCRRDLHFTHYDTGKIGGRRTLVPGMRYHHAQIALLLVLIGSSALAGTLWGIGPALVTLFVAAAMLMLGLRRHFAQRSVWFCTPCDAYFIGPRLLPWRTPRSPQRRHMIE